MGVVTYEMEVATKIPPAKMFEAFFVEGDKIITKAVPQAIKSVVILEGNGGPGTVKQINFGEGSNYRYVKERTDVMDKETLTYAYTVIEGDALGEKLEKISNEFKIEDSGDGGSICKAVSNYYPIGDNEIKEDEIKAGKMKAVGLFKAIEAYILAQP